MKAGYTLKYSFLFLFLIASISLEAQSNKQQELEQRRQELTHEIQQINTLLFQGKKEQKSVLSRVENLNYKIRVRQNLIKITNQQANLLTREINTNQTKISTYRDKLKLLKEEYAAMVVKSYKSKSEQSKVMFLLSSINFQQAYKRLEYIKQYANYQKKQGQKIKIKTIELQELNKELGVQKAKKQELINKNRAAKNRLEDERIQHQTLIKSIKKNLTTYTSQIRIKQKEVDKIDKEIEKIIKDAIAKSNKKAGKTGKTNTFVLTAEDKILANNFTANKGKLPWPVKSGVLTLRYGLQRSPIDKSIPINSNGVRIATAKNQKVRAVFQGKVMAIITPKNGNNTVLIRHGNYITVYKNLLKIYVNKGDKISTKQDIGEVLTNKASGDTILNFVIFKDGKTQNPAHWIYKMR